MKDLDVDVNIRDYIAVSVLNGLLSQSMSGPFTKYRSAYEDLIKTTVLPQSLSSFTSECIENGDEIPECISYYLKPSLRLYS